MGIKVGINGFGRIGRYFFRTALKHPEIEIVAINDLANPEILAHLLKYDSVHGVLDCDIRVGKNSINIDNNEILVTCEKDPEKIPWYKSDVSLVAECTGTFTKREDASKHLGSGVKKVLISAPGVDSDITIITGVNQGSYNPETHNVISNASCTSNGLAPIIKIIENNFGLKNGMMTTIHSYTQDQRLMDFPHKDLRRARGGALSLVPTTTGAVKAVIEVMPELKDKITGLSVRVPTPNVSIIDFVATIEKNNVSKSNVNSAFKEASETYLSGIVGYSELPLVSVDYLGCEFSSVIDAENTDCSGNMVKIIAWYDNEAGYSNRMVDLIKLIGKDL